MSNLVGDVKTESENQALRLEFLAELEDLMLKYEVSTINVAWAFGTPFNELRHAMEDSQKTTTEKVAISEGPPEVHPVNSVIGGGRSGAPSTEGASFRRAGEPPTARPALEVLEGVVGKMDAEEEENTPEATPTPAE